MTTSFTCIVCNQPFTLAKDVLDRYPGWEPKYCREHSRNKVKSKGSKASKPARKRTPARARTATVEENLPVAEVLQRYTGGPDTGLFTDGSCQPNPGPGGWGVVWAEAGEEKERRYGHDAQTTNNRMEMTAIIEALKLTGPDDDVTLYTDSKLCVQTLNEWAKGWEARGWKKKSGPIKNLELVQEAYALKNARPKVKLVHIAAHAGNRWNEVADALSTAWMRDEV